MSEQGTIENDQTFQESARWRLLAGIAIVAALVLLALLFLGRERNRMLMPERPIPTPGDTLINGQSVLVTFNQLNRDPYAFLGQRIRATGDFARLPAPPCVPAKGPPTTWSLIAEDLRLDAAGFDRIIRLVPEGTSLTVEGVWKLYEGPVGCGKEPADAQIWFLQVTQIVQPNPLPGSSGQDGSSGQAAAIQLAPSATADLEAATITVTPSATPLPTTAQTMTATVAGTITIVPDGSATAVATSATIPSPSATPSSLPQPTATTTASATPRPSATSTPSRTAATAAPTATVRSVVVTSTPGPTATATTEGYPAPTATGNGYPASTETPDPYG